MKIIGICGSPKRKHSSSLFALELAMLECERQGIATEVIELGKYKFSPCMDCGGCRDKLTCSQKDDFLNEILPKISDPDVKGFIFSSPVYFGGMTAQMKMLFDRAVALRRNGFLWENKVASAITIGGSRNGGQELTSMDIVKACMIHSMIIAPDASPTSHFGGNLWARHEGGVENDQMGIATAKNTGKKVVELVKKLNR
jgi:multimeric flavodoxin WrbA